MSKLKRKWELIKIVKQLFQELHDSSSIQVNAQYAIDASTKDAIEIIILINKYQLEYWNILLVEQYDKQGHSGTTKIIDDIQSKINNQSKLTIQ
tara:strand:- start:711 stop:992 length:282 start_codon:yes stop_codon:yes gene_type:complete